MGRISLQRASSKQLAKEWLAVLVDRLGHRETNSAFIGCLVTLLDALEWQGAARQIAEALPHESDELSFAEFRDVLARLGFGTTHLTARPEEVTERLLPCLFVAGNGDPYVLLGRDADGIAVFEGKAAACRHVPALPAGDCYLVKPETKERPASATEVGGWLRGIAKHFRGLILAILAMTFAINVLALVGSLAIMTVYDQVIAKSQPEMMPALLFGVGLATLSELGFRLLRARGQAYMGARLDYLVGTKVFEQIMHLPPAFTERAPVGGQVTRIREFEFLREFFTGALAGTLLDLPFVVVFVAVIGLIAGPLAAVPLVLLVLYLLIGLITEPAIRDRMKRSGEARSQRYAFVVEMIWWLRSIKQMGAEDLWRERFRKLSAEAAWANHDGSRLQAIAHNAAHVLMVAAGTATLGIGVLLAMEGDMTMGALIATMMLVWRILAPMQTLFGQSNRIEQMQQSLRQLVAMLGYEREQEPGDAPVASIAFEGRLAFNRVSMRYSAEGNPAILGLTLEIEPGEMLAVSGGSGSGKTTLAKLALGVYRPQAGTVTLDGVDIRQLRPITLRQTLAYVPQRNHAFAGTLFDNIAMSNPAASVDDVRRACDLAGLLDVIESLPAGFDTRFREGLLSHVPQGFLRKLGLARAFLRDAPVLILDEPAGSADEADERDFIAALQRLKGTRTIVMITHRPSHMRLCDRLLVLEQGQPLHLGPPELVLARMAAGA
ncbi:MAG: ABC transporter transmembrane domain-containing protein [Magnetospirillum sp. WYHS-4]